MAEPFVARPLVRPNFFQRLFRLAPRANPVIELENLLARAARVRDVSERDVACIAGRYRTSFTTRHQDARAALYRRAVEHALADRRFDSAEIDELEHLKHLLGHSDRFVELCHHEVASRLYRASVLEVVSDGRVAPEERRFLEQLERRLHLNPVAASEIYAASARLRLGAALRDAVADRQLSPAEDQELSDMARSLGVRLDIDDRTRAMHDRLRLYWRIRNGDLPTIEVAERLQRGEAAYLERDIAWYENRTVTRSIRYGGVTGRARIAKGIYLRAGEVAVQKVQSEEMKEIDRGRLLLTSKRIIVRGSRKNSTIALRKVLDFESFANGIELHKDTGRPIFLEFDRDVDVFAMTLDRALQDANA